ncbi:MAG: hypothetical protein ACLQS0_00745 [Syntrophobacteraceae bacterium]
MDSRSIDRTLHPLPSFVQYVGVNHSRADVFLPEEVLNSVDIPPSDPVVAI